MSARDLPDDIARSAALMDELLSEYFAPPPNVTVTEWAERHRVLSAKDSAEPGPYRVARTPFALEPQDALSPYSPVEEVVLMWGAQTSKTTVGGNWVGSSIDLRPGPMMIVQPTIDTAKRYSRQRLTPMIEESPRLRTKVRENRSRDDANTTLLKEYAGGFMVVAGANSAAGLRSMPIRDIFFDEIDAYPLDVDGEGDPISLAEARQSTFARRKRLKTSTPTTKGFSRIEDAFLATDQRYYHVACPHCTELQRLEWGADKPYGIKWAKDAQGAAIPATAHYVCRAHGCIIEEHHKPAFLRCAQLGGQARWVPANPGAAARKRGYHLSSLYSPLGFLSWRELVEEWVTAREAAKTGDQSKLRAFVNTRLAETWEEQGDKVEHHELARRAEDYELGMVPRGGLMLTMGVDVQPDRLEARVWAWGRGEESWLVQRHIIYGDPNLDEAVPGSPWARLTSLRREPVRHSSGAQMLVEATAIDTGGHNTQAVYHYCRTHAASNVLAIKGASQPGRAVIGKPSQIDVRWNGRTIPRGLRLWAIGTDTAKHLIYGRLRLEKQGPGYVHLPAVLRTTDEFEQMTAERLATRYIKGHPKLEWVKPNGKRNEALDCAVYAYAAACWLGIQTFREHAWTHREQRYLRHEPDLFDAPMVAAIVQQAPNQTAEADVPGARPVASRSFSRNW
ncbi:MAG: phage terminase large subunit family protein [Ottowia sp.]|uniref:phage terminase large subunit family protein n=1 Tax=Ottowia sp. TaxID=1898956 RepID=UPI003C7829D3